MAINGLVGSTIVECRRSSERTVDVSGARLLSSRSINRMLDMWVAIFFPRDPDNYAQDTECAVE